MMGFLFQVVKWELTILWLLCAYSVFFAPQPEQEPEKIEAPKRTEDRYIVMPDGREIPVKIGG